MGYVVSAFFAAMMYDKWKREEEELDLNPVLMFFGVLICLGWIGIVYLSRALMH